MNGTENTESGKLIKTLYMHLNDFLIIKDGLLMHGDENTSMFVTYIEEGHIYDILIETFDFKTKTIRNKKYTVSDKKVCTKHIHVDVYIKDFTEHMDVDTYSGDYTILRIFADGTDPSVYRTIRIVDVTGDDHSTCVANDSEDKNENQTDDTTNVSETDNADEQEQVIPDDSDTCEDYDPEEDIKELLDDVEKLQYSLINLVERSFDIKRDIDLHSENIIGSQILQNEVGLLNTYLSSINMVYGNNLDRVTLNIKDTLGI